MDALYWWVIPLSLSILRSDLDSRLILVDQMIIQCRSWSIRYRPSCRFMLLGDPIKSASPISNKHGANFPIHVQLAVQCTFSISTFCIIVRPVIYTRLTIFNTTPGSHFTTLRSLLVFVWRIYHSY